MAGRKERTESMKGRNVLTALFAVVCLVGLVGAASHLYSLRKSAQAQVDAVVEIELPQEQVPLEEKPVQDIPAMEEEPEEPDPYGEELSLTDLEALREVNPDVVGWISIPETQLSYPLLQGEDNEYYLNHTWERAWNSAGSIYLESQVSSDLSDFNTLVYGHRMRDGSLFGSLRDYNKQDHWEKHPSVYIADDNGVHRYDIFAAHEVGVREITYGLKIESEKVKQAFIDFSLERSVIDTGVVPTVEDRILTMSTCTGTGYDTRWVVQARLAKTFA